MLKYVAAVLAVVCVSTCTVAALRREPGAATPQPLQGEPKQDPPKAEPAAPVGEKKEDGLWFKLPFDRGEGSLRLCRQNGMLRADVDARQPYYAGDGQRDYGTLLDLMLTVDGLNGRHLVCYPSPIWHPRSPDFPPFRIEGAWDKAESFKILAEAPGFGLQADVKYYDTWKATVYVDLRRVLVPGNTPASVADEWRLGLLMGNKAARTVWPQGFDIQEPAKSAKALVAFKFSELPEMAELEDDPREAAIAAETAMHEAMGRIRAQLQLQSLDGAVGEALKAAEKHPNAVWARHISWLLAFSAEMSEMGKPEWDSLALLKAYVDAAPGQSQIQLNYLEQLLMLGHSQDAAKHLETLLASPLCAGKKDTAAGISFRHAAKLAQNGFLSEAEALLKPWEGTPEATTSDSTRLLYNQANLELTRLKKQWDDELKFRDEDAKKKNPRLVLQTTKGKVVLELFEDDAPNTVAALVSLAQKGFYNGLTFHRFVQNFVIQGGCPKGDGTGDPGYRLKSEVNRRNHFRGMVGMACSRPGAGTEGSQFYICLSDAANVKNLSGTYVIAGRVIEGMDVAEKLRAGDKMEKVTAENLRDHEYVPQTLPPLKDE